MPITVETAAENMDTIKEQDVFLFFDNDCYIFP